MQEIWKDIKEYEEHYQISNLGRVKSLYFTSNILHKRIYREKILKPKIGKKDNCMREVSYVERH